MNRSTEPEPKSTRAVSAGELRGMIALLCCLPLFALRLALLLTPPQMFDFITYWASGRLYLTGGHPYSASAMLATERLQGWPYPPMLTFCPPWALPILGIMAYPPFRPAQIAWFAISLALNCLSALGLWIYFDGERRRAWIAILICATFIPMGGAELQGQITPLMLASLTGFLLCVRSDRYFVAGVLLLGLGFKPHLLYLVAVAILFWVVKKRAWTMLAGAALSYGLAIVAALLHNRNSLDYLGHTVNAAMEVSCGLGGVLRGIFGIQLLWLQFVPCILGSAWFLCYWAKHRHQWDWQVDLPLLLLVSVGTSPYYWYLDFILILPALISVAARGGYRTYFAPIAYLTTQILIYEAYRLSEAWRSAAGLLWIALYCVARAETTRSKNSGTLSALPLFQSRETVGPQ
jgi:hypothetical protein